MHNERDWREQLHLGPDRTAAGEEPAFRRLEGSNLWPADPNWRKLISDYVTSAARLGELILQGLASALGADPASFGRVARDGYLVAKLIGYHPQPMGDVVRSGVAAHVDFSWVTITLQDSEGLDVRCPDGQWTPVSVPPGAVWVHAGELLAYATRGRYAATPHRVINRASDRTRVSIPVFINPPLDAFVRPLAGTHAPLSCVNPTLERDAEKDHVHRVLAPLLDTAEFHFGQAEWRRKGLGMWCFTCCSHA
jgi:isopenicillin N synthase-like dioxygenase